MPVAIPMLAVTTSGASLREISNGVANKSRTRCATTFAPAANEAPSTSTTNSSPPRRPTESPSRSALASLTPTAASNWSPALWPKVSFTLLKSSRSRNSAATGVCSRRERAIIWSSRSRMSARLGSPVSESWKAEIGVDRCVRAPF